MTDYLYDFPNSTNGMDDLLVGTASANTSFIPLLLLFIFLFIFLGGSQMQRARRGDSDYAQWGLISMIGVLMVSLALSLINGLISTTTLVIVVILTLLFGLWFFFNRRGGEQ